MKYQGKYEVDPSFIKSGGLIGWVTTGNGVYIIAKRDGKKYFVKRNIHVRYPTKGLPKMVYDKYKTEADAIEKKQEKLRKLMDKLVWEKDHIVVEADNFWDDEKMFVTVTPCIPDALPDIYDYSVLSLDKFIKLSTDTAKALEKLHASGVIHGDLKVKNILVSYSGGAYTPYLIDFDSSYPADSIPGWEQIGGSDGYRSPEITDYYNKEGAVSSRDISGATDIFSLGIVMHKWWTNTYPGSDLEEGFTCDAVACDKAVIINKKFNVHIGKKRGATLTSLMNWMFAQKPSKRPTAQDVLLVLEDKKDVPDEYQVGDDLKPFDSDLWGAHKLIGEFIPVDQLRSMGVTSFKRINEGYGSMGLKYRIVLSDGTEKTMSLEELCKAGYAKMKDADIGEPWEEHKIEFEPASVIASKGYAKIRKMRVIFRNRYLITLASGRVIDKGFEWLIAEGLAHPQLVEVKADGTPWPEHGTQYNLESMARFDVKSISRVEIGGQHRYRVVYNTIIDGKNKVNDNVSPNNLRLMGFFK